MLINSADRIAIFGARGMAGSAISRALECQGYHNQLLPSRQHLDLLDGGAVDQWIETKKPDVVILAAAKVGGIHANNTYPADFLLENIKIQTHVIESSWRFGVRRLLFLGSSCIYPKFAQQPICEESLLKGELEPTNEWYAIAKIAGIKLCDSLRKQYGFDAISVMPTNLYGPGDNYHSLNSHVLPALIKKFSDALRSSADSVSCWGSGNPSREFLHVDDLAKACVFLLENWSPLSPDSPKDIYGRPLGILNIGTGQDITIRRLANLIASTLGFDGSIDWDTSMPDGTPKKLLDVSRINHLGWKYSIELHSGIQSAIEDYQVRYLHAD